jgi:GT2 family glycosyltransferase
MAKLSIIIVNYNTKDLLTQCLKSLYGPKHPFDFEVIVVDNGSQDSSVAMIQQDFKQVRLLQKRDNLGFAKANNLGLAIARGEYILLLNSDTIVLNDALEKLVTFLDQTPEVAVVTGRLVYPDFSDQKVARRFPTPLNALFGRTTFLTRLFPKNKYTQEYLLSARHNFKEPFEVDWVSGACLMVKRRVLEEVGLLDERFWMYWEDADLCWRIKQRGWKVYCIPRAIIIHYEGKSVSKKGKNRAILEFNKSAYYYYRKHFIKFPFSPLKFMAAIFFILRTLVLLGINSLKADVKQAEVGDGSFAP